MKTKSYLLAAASATMLLAGCTQEEVVSIPESRAIGFGTYVSNTSRAGESGAATDPGATTTPSTTETPVPAPATDTDIAFLKDENKGNGFYVFGIYEDTEQRGEVTVFDGVSESSHVKPLPATSSGEGSSNSEIIWGYSPNNYWLENKKYRFAAYAPAAARGNGNASFVYSQTQTQERAAAVNLLKIDGFEAKQPTDNNRVDLVVAEGNNDGYIMVPNADNTLPTMDPVRFKFYHALSKVRFSFKNRWRNDVSVTIKNVSVSQLFSKGNLITTGTLAAATSTTPLIVDGFQAWSSLSDKVTYTWSETFNTNVYDKEGVFENYFIPQTLPVDGSFVLKFSVQIANASGSGPDLGPGTNKADMTVKIPVNKVSAWEPGKFYHYILIIDGDFFGLRPIEFDVIEVANWAVEGHDDILTGEGENDKTSSSTTENFTVQ